VKREKYAELGKLDGANHQSATPDEWNTHYLQMESK